LLQLSLPVCIKVKSPDISILLLTGKPEQQWFAIIRSGVLTSISSRQRSTLPELTDLAPGYSGTTENAGVEKSARSKMQWWKMREWKCRHSPAGVENAGVEIWGRLGHNPAGVENAGVNYSVQWQ